MCVAQEPSSPPPHPFFVGRTLATFRHSFHTRLYAVCYCAQLTDKKWKNKEPLEKWEEVKKAIAKASASGILLSLCPASHPSSEKEGQTQPQPVLKQIPAFDVGHGAFPSHVP